MARISLDWLSSPVRVATRKLPRGLSGKTRISIALWLGLALTCQAPSTGAADALAVKIREAVDGTGIQLATTDTAIQYTVHLRATNASPVRGLIVGSTALTGPNASLYPLTLEVRPPARPAKGPELTIDLDAATSLPLDLSAALPLIGRYAGKLELTAGNRSREVPIVITRSKGVTPVEILPVDPIRGTLEGGAGSFEWRVTLRETAGAAATAIEPPVLTSLTVKQGVSAQKAGVSNHTVEWFDAGDTKRATVLKTLSFGAPGQAKQFVVRIGGLTHPGEYSGQLRVLFADAPAAEQSVTLFAKSAWWCAALWVALGFVASYVLRLAFKIGRPRAQQQVRLARFRQVLERWAGLSNLGARERSVLDAIRELVDRLEDRLDGRGAGALTDAELDEMDNKLTLVPEWINEMRGADASRPPAPAEVWALLDSVEAYLRRPSPPAVAFTEARGKLDSVPTTLKNALLAGVRTGATTLRDAATARLADPDTTQSERGALQQVLDHCQLVEDRASAGHIEEASARLDEAKRAYVGFLVQHLERRLGTATPLGFSNDPGKWNELKQEIVARLRELPGKDLTTVVQLYNAAYLTFLHRSLEALRGYAEAEARRLKGTPATTPMGQAVEASGQAITALLATLGASVDFKVLAKTAERYAQLERDVAEQSELAASGGGAQATVATGHLGPEPAGAFGGAAVEAAATRLVRSTAVASHTRVARPGLAALSRKLFLYDAFFMVVLGFVTVLSGLKLFYLDDPAWGGVSSAIAAVLWGLGVQQVAGASYDMGTLATRLNMPGLVEPTAKP
jgi:hypothetical protein